MNNNFISFSITLFITFLIFFIPTKQSNPVLKEKAVQKKVVIKNFTLMNYKIIPNHQLPSEDNTKKNKKEKRKEENKNSQQAIKNNQTEKKAESKEVEKQIDASQETSKPIKIINYTPDFTIDQIPVYPDKAKRMGQEGTVQILVITDINGKIQQAVIKKSSGYPLLDTSALKAVRKWRFSQLNLQDNKNYFKTEIEFKLRKR
ncbi:MAG: energy transducer TonB [Spirochaetes bacterium]|nr:energy transducer TonB [Spirochaetota bacterium]